MNIWPSFVLDHCLDLILSCYTFVGPLLSGTADMALSSLPLAYFSLSYTQFYPSINIPKQGPRAVPLTSSKKGSDQNCDSIYRLRQEGIQERRTYLDAVDICLYLQYREQGAALAQHIGTWKL